jgi:hypothetical protein
LPFSRKLTPAAFPALTTTSPVARTEVCAGAIRVSSATGLPSAMIETHVVFSARISKVKLAGGFAGAAGGVVFATGELAEATGGLAPGLLAGVVVDAVEDGAGEAACAEGGGAAGPGGFGDVLGGGGVVAAEIVSVGDDFPGFGELTEPDGRDAGDDVGATGAGPGGGDGCAAAAARDLVPGSLLR